MVILVAFALTFEAETIMPGILTSFEMTVDLRSRRHDGLEVEVSKTCQKKEKRTLK